MRILARRGTHKLTPDQREQAVQNNEVIINSIENGVINLETVTSDNSGGLGPTAKRVTIEIDLNKYYAEKGFVWIFLSSLGDACAVDGRKVLNSNQSLHSVSNAYAGVEAAGGPYFILCCGPSIDRSVLMINKFVYYDGTAEQTFPGDHVTDILAENLGDDFPWLKEIQAKWRAKQDLQFAIDPLESLSSLEKQVDLLSQLLMTLLPDSVGDKKALLQKFLDHGSSTTAADLQEAIGIKQTLRDVVKAYRSSK